MYNNHGFDIQQIFFDKIIESPIKLSTENVGSLGELPYYQKTDRNESGEIINGHIDSQYISVSLPQIRNPARYIHQPIAILFTRWYL